MCTQEVHCIIISFWNYSGLFLKLQPNRWGVRSVRANSIAPIFHVPAGAAVKSFFYVKHRSVARGDRWSFESHYMSEWFGFYGWSTGWEMIQGRGDGNETAIIISGLRLSHLHQENTELQRAGNTEVPVVISQHVCTWHNLGAHRGSLCVIALLFRCKTHIHPAVFSWLEET